MNGQRAPFYMAVLFSLLGALLTLLLLYQLIIRQNRIIQELTERFPTF